MEYVYVDTALLAVPNYAVDAASAQELIDRINHFSQMVSASFPVTVVISSDATERLWEINCGPDYDQIKNFIELMEIEHFYTARDLIRQYHTILDRAVKADVIAPVEVKTISSFESAPPLPEALVPVALRSETERVFATVAAIQSLNDVWNVGSAIQDTGTSSYHIRAHVEQVSGILAPRLGDMPIEVSKTVRAFRHLSEFVSTGASERLWTNSSSAEDLHFALTIGALALLSDIGRLADLGEIRRFYIGPKFEQSLRVCQCFGSGRFASTTRAICTQLIAGVCTRPIGKFGRPDQVERQFDSAKAWRVHLTEAAEGLRLMYWATDQYIEFANVGVKHELEIVRGYAGGATAIDLAGYF